MACTPGSWSDIPPELAGLVLGRLPARVDRVRFAAVCPQWRAAARQFPPPPPLPLLVLMDGIFYSLPRSEPHRFARRGDGSIVTACDNWLVLWRLNSFLLMDPFSGATMTLPAASRLYIPNDGDDSGKGGDWDEGDDSVGRSETGFMDSMDTKNFILIKLIVCSPHLVAALFSVRPCYRIAVCRPGASLWTVAWNLSLWITDMAFYQGKLYAIDDNENLLALDISVDDNTGDPWVARIGRVIKGDYQPVTIDKWTSKRMVYLVESQGSLLMVRRRIFYGYMDGEAHIRTFTGQCEPELVAFEADFRRSQWAKVTTLRDDQALFLGPCSRAVRMSQCDTPDSRSWFLNDDVSYYNWASIDSTIDMTNTKSSSPLPMISWPATMPCAGAAWLFPLD